MAEPSRVSPLDCPLSSHIFRALGSPGPEARKAPLRCSAAWFSWLRFFHYQAVTAIHDRRPPEISLCFHNTEEFFFFLTHLQKIPLPLVV